MNNINNENLQGYKITNSHFKIGAKIHIDDFFYISKIFQNSYFANRFAIQTAQYLLTQIISESDTIGISLDKPNYVKNTNISYVIIGYGKYSELLITRVANILNSYFVKKEINLNVNYDIISDSEEPFLIRNIPLTYKDRFFIIVPIGSTLTTCIKMHNFMLKKKIYSPKNKKYTYIKKDSIVKPLLNLVLVADNKYQEYSENKNEKIRIDELFKLFGWTDIKPHDKIITVKTQNNELIVPYTKPKRSSETIEVQQKYFIELYTKWNTTHNCKSCFPRYAFKEKPLIETDRASIIPQLILSTKFPFSGRSLNEYKADQFIINPDYYYYGHQKYGNTEHIHFINPNDFLDKHKPDIIKWLTAIGEDPFFYNANKNKKIILLTPEGNLNSNFASVVNEILFKDAANIIQYDTNNDFVQNFIALYGNIITKADHIYYVDDNILTGRTFRSSNNFIKRCFNLSDQNNGFNGVIALIVRTDDYAIDSIYSELNKVNKFKMYTYKYLRAPSLVSHHLECPMCKKRNFYDEIVQTCSLNSLKKIFLEKKYELKLIDDINQQKKRNNLKFFHFPKYLHYKFLNEIKEGENTEDNFNSFWKLNEIHLKKLVKEIQWRSKYHHIIKLHVSDILFKLLSEDGKIAEFFNSTSSFHELNKYVYDKIMLLVGADNQNFISYIYIREQIIKVISLPPFTYYLDIKKNVLKWLIIDSNKILKDQAEKIKKEEYFAVFNDFRYLKLLLRRLSILQSNFLLRKTTFSILYDIYKAGEKLILQNINNSEITLTKIRKNILHRTRDQDVYLKQLENNNKYKIRTIETYQYFISACIKEIIHNNEYKSINIEKVVTNIFENNYKKINVNPGFNHLLYIIKLENIGVINKIMRYNYRELLEKNRTFTTDDVIDVLTDKSDIYNLHLHDFLREEKLYKSRYKTIKEYPLFNHFVNLYHTLFSLLHPELIIDKKIEGESIPNENIRFKDHIKDILRLITKIIGIEKNFNISLYIKYKQDKNGIWPIRYEDEKNTEELSEKSLVFKMMDGIESLPSGPNQTFVEYIKIGNKFETVVKNLYVKKENSERSEILNIDNYYEYKCKKYNHLLYYRISNISFDENKKKTSSDDVIAVLFIGLKGKEDVENYFDCERLRYLLLVKNLLAQFILVNVQTDSFKSYIEESKENHQKELSMHGKNRLNAAFRQKVNDINIDLFSSNDKNCLIFWGVLSSQDSIVDLNAKIAKENGQLETIEINSTELKHIILLVANEIFRSSKFEKETTLPNEINYAINDLSDKFTFTFVEDLLKIILAEMFVNIKRHSGWLYVKNKADLEIIFDLQIVYANNMHWLQLKNNIYPIDEIYHQNRIIQLSKHDGLDLILTIYNDIMKFNLKRDDIVAVDNEKNTFSILLPLANYKMYLL